MAVSTLFPNATRTAGTYLVNVAPPRRIPAGTPKNMRILITSPTWGTTPGNTIAYLCERSLDWGTQGASAVWDNWGQFSANSGTANSTPPGKITNGLQGGVWSWDGQEMWVRQTIVLTGPDLVIGMSVEVLP